MTQSIVIEVIPPQNFEYSGDREYEYTGGKTRFKGSPPVDYRDIGPLEEHCRGEYEWRINRFCRRGYSNGPFDYRGRFEPQKAPDSY